jgi:putative peptidoglycan lipid II flippase
MTARDNLEKNTRTNSVLTLVSRCMGLVRDGAISRIFGAGALASAFYFAFLIPNLFRRLFGEGALSAAFLPLYSKLHEQNPQRAKAFATLTVAKLVMLLGVLTLISELILGVLISVQHEPSASLQLTMIMLPYMPLVCLVAIFGAMLHVHDTFGPTASAPIILNGFMIAGAYGFVSFFDNPFNHMILIGISVVLAGVVQIVWSLFALRKHAWFTTEAKSANGEFKTMLRNMIPMVLGLGTLQINTLLDGVVANWSNLFGPSIFGLEYPLGDGAMASLTWAQRLYQLPLGVFGIALATAIYPLLAKQVNDATQFASTMRRGLRTVIFIGLPASAGLILVRDPLAMVVFQGANCTAQDAIVVGSILLGYAPAVWAYSMTQVVVKGYYAKNDTMTPVKVAIFCVCLNFLLNITLIWTPLGTAGLAWSTAICGVIQVSILLAIFKRHVPTLVDPQVLKSWSYTALLTLILGIVVGVLMHLAWDQNGTWLHSLLVLLGSVVGGIAVMIVGGMVLRRPELYWSIGRQR